MRPEEFELLVDRALEELPGDFQQRMENISIVVEDYPSEHVLAGLRPRPSKFNLLGVYIGVPYTQRPAHQILGKLPDRIELYQKNIEAICATDREVVQQIKETVIHEVGHYFGLDEATLRRLQR
ncbi:MAG TPA: metallopeptidase family protein [Candidatus Edwardsbacteria bacterium]|nr:metallopeptidase family protein [Candidatus Edwardsbacteria bacterium]